ncbi:helix-turn-helix transcriptional regulator [Chryseobacterium formosus]|uniref:Helix-turn-helix transcriptional regulator n=1 Tax=Chryseobacterium formosus TaxID=1537363 RepID=A0ABT3XS55_9FLAO|nr:response regulator transcription factor [Chryseobacterium formosus]MCX8524959.1 helix-turn-helix transcriptional regulator [Chryseobacterium formosus]
MNNRKLYSVNSISEFHRISGLPKPQHPLISLVDYSLVDYQIEESEISWVQDLYFMGFKRDIQGKLHYGQSQYDFDEGLMCFIAPRQVVKMIISKSDVKPSGYLLAFHPDFIWNTSLAKIIHKYPFFGYDVNEALFLSEKEEETLIGIFKSIEREYQSGIDQFTQNIIISQIEVILNYCERFYQRQFITRKKTNHQVLDKLEILLEEYFTNENIINNGLPTAQLIAEQLNVSTNYLSSLLKSLTGQTTQQHIHGKLIEKAKEKLSTTELSVSEIAYELGFEHSQSFSKLFKAKTDISPLEFRKSFN